MRSLSGALALALCLAFACSREEAAAPGSEAAEAAPASEPAATPLQPPYTGHDYACAGGPEFNARIVKGNAILTIEGKTLTLAPMGGPDARYEGEGLTFVARGNEATLVRQGERSLACTAK